MNILKRNLFCALSMVLLLFVLTGCSDLKQTSSNADGKKNPSKELTIAYGLDTNAQPARGSGDMLLEIFTTERLVELEGTKVVPGLAESWDIQNEGKTIVFHLKKDIQFSDGSPFNAKAVQFTYNRLMQFENTSWTEIDRLESIKAPDPHTVTFHYKPGLQGYIALTSFAEYHTGILSPNSVGPARNPSAPIIRFIGTGPWKVDDYKKDQYTVFVPNENYRDGQAALEKITVKTIPKAEGRVLALKSGDVDVIVDYYHGGSAYTPRNMIKNLQNEGFKVLKKEMPMTTLIAFNYKKKPWNDIRVRKAVNHAVNKDDISALFDGWIRVATDGLFSATAPYNANGKVKAIEFNKQKAQHLLKESNFAPERKISLIAQGENPDEVKLCELIKAQLADIGLDLDLQVLEAGVYSDRRLNGQYDLCIWYAAGPERRKFTRMDGRFNPSAPEFGSSGCFSSPEISAALNQAVSSFDQNKRRDNFNKFYQLLRDQAAFVPLYFDAVFVITRPEVKGIEFLSSEPRFDQAYIKE